MNEPDETLITISPSSDFHEPNSLIETTDTTSAPQHTSTNLPLLDQFQISISYFDAIITGLYHLYGTSIDSLVTTSITNKRAEAAQLRVENEVMGYTALAVSTLLISPGESQAVEHNPVLLPNVIDSLMNEKKATLVTRITLVEESGETELYYQTRDVLLYARRDFPNWLSPERPFPFVAKYLAAWVTPNDPAIERLLRDAANWHESGAITSGYHYKDDDFDRDVQYRLEAIWNAIGNDYNVTYVSTTVSFAPGAKQRIRLPGEVLEQRSGNCIELALLMASAAEAIDLQTKIVLVPGHAFMGVRTGSDGSYNYFIETTMIGDAPLRDAIKVGNQEWVEIEGRTQGEGYIVIRLDEAREIGILPMPWR